MTKIDLGECETLLRYEYNISINETLYIKKIDVIQEGMKTYKVDYAIYSKLFGTNLIKLNLTVCEKSKIIISIPFVITGNLDKFNINSGYYNDICYTTTSEYGTDITLKDRRKEFIDNNAICQEDCAFSEYDHDTAIAKCSCKVKAFFQSFADMSFDKTKLLENFKNIKNYINYKFLICYKKLFKKEGIINNVGFYLILGIIFFHIIAIIIFYEKQFPLIKGRIDYIVTQFQSSIKNKKREKNDRLRKHQSNEFENSGISIYKSTKKRKNKKKLISKKKNINDSKIKIESKSKIDNGNKIRIKENIKNFIDDEINGLSYFEAIQYDKRSYCKYYVSLLKTQHNLICAIFNNKDYNSGIIKIDIFIIGFTIEYTVNALFYNDDTMHNIYESKGQFDFETQIPIIIYSTLISFILNIPLNFLALSNEAIINFKQDNTKYNIMNKSKKLKHILTIKFILYFIISFLLLVFFWYYISLFCVIYKNTQIHLLKDTLMSFGLSLIIPFGFYLLPGLFRIPALSNLNKNKEYLYNFSKFLQAF